MTAAVIRPNPGSPSRRPARQKHGAQTGPPKKPARFVRKAGEGPCVEGAFSGLLRFGKYRPAALCVVFGGLDRRGGWFYAWRHPLQRQEPLAPPLQQRPLFCAACAHSQLSQAALSARSALARLSHADSRASQAAWLASLAASQASRAAASQRSTAFRRSFIPSQPVFPEQPQEQQEPPQRLPPASPDDGHPPSDRVFRPQASLSSCRAQRISAATLPGAQGYQGVEDIR